MCEGPLHHIREHPEIGNRDLDLIEQLHGRGAAILDIGAGRGGFVQLATSRGLRAIALDVEPSAPVLWRRTQVTGVLADAFRPPFRDSSFDVARLKEIIEHVEDPRSLIRGIESLLRAGGHLIAHVPSPYSQLFPVGNFWDDYTHVRPFSRLGLRRLLEDSGMRVVSIDGYVAGRNVVERVLGVALGRVLPHTYRVVAQRRR